MAAVASRYARAFADVVVERKLGVDDVRQQLSSVVTLVRQSAELRNVLESPAIPKQEKIDLLDALATRMGLSKPVRNFVAVLVDHKRIPMLPQIATQFERELNERLGVTEAQITSARELAAGEKRALEAQIAKMVGKQVRAQYTTDQAMLGGAMVKIGSTIYDGSVRGQLRRMKDLLSAD